MTIAAAYLASEGVVLGTDSTTTVSTQNGGVLQLLNYAQKLFEVGESSRLGVCTWGAGNVNGISHRTLVARLGDELDLDKVKVADAAAAFLQIIEREYGDGKTTGTVGYVLGGWDPDNHLPQCYHISLSAGKKPKWEALALGNAMFFGNPEFFSRVFLGYDSKLENALLNELKGRGAVVQKGKEKFEDVFRDAFRKTVGPLMAVGFQDLPIREALDFVHTYLHITIKAFKFRSGAPICGGPIELAFISTDRKFRWVCHKSFERAVYEQEL